MIDDPYRVLGVSPDASDEEIKRAYRALAKKYHPDMNPGDESAAQMMNRINEAYDQIKNPHAYTKTQTYQDPFAGWYRQAESAGQSDDARMESARRFLYIHEFTRALQTLETIPPGSRTAQWYYYAAIANANLGNRVLAYSQIDTACRMDPYNASYERLRQQLSRNAEQYTQAQRGFGFDGTEFSRFCGTCAAANLLCYCLGGAGCPMIFCC